MNRGHEIPAALHAAFKGAADNSNQPVWLTARRTASFDAFAAMGLPNTRHEEWKYTSLRPLLTHDWVMNNGALQLPALAQAHLAAIKAADPQAILLSTFNGKSVPHEETGLATQKMDGCSIQTFAQDISGDPETSRVQKFERRLEAFEHLVPEFGSLHVREQSWGRSSEMLRLHQALASDGWIIEATSEVTAKIHVVHFVDADRASAAFPTTFLSALPGSQVVLAESVESIESIGAPSHGSKHSSEFLLCPRLEVIADDRSKVQLIQMWSDKSAASGSIIGSTRLFIGASCHIEAVALTDGSGLKRLNCGAVMLGAHSDLQMRGLSTAAGSATVDHHTSVDHLAPDTACRHTFKGIAAGKARVVFNGKIFVRKSAIRTSSHQQSKALLMSAEAETDCKPQLEIDTDDVQCSHGTSIGQLNPDELFYLRSRGIPESVARHMLAEGFARDTFDGVLSSHEASTVMRDVVSLMAKSLARMGL